MGEGRRGRGESVWGGGRRDGGGGGGEGECVCWGISIIP